MGKALFGYRRSKGKYYINEDEAVKVRKLFVAYVSGCLMPSAMEAAGLGGGHSIGYHIINEERYCGNDQYPAIIDHDIFTRAQIIRNKRANNANLVYQRYYTITEIKE